MKILIPTCKQRSAVDAMCADLARAQTQGDVFASCLPESAAINRNWCLSHLIVGEVSIMLDDDIEGFYQDWIDDLVAPLDDPSVVMVSARLMNPDGSVGQTCSRCYDLTPDTIEIKSNGVCVLPTAAIAFRHLGLCYDENFVGSGYEDNDMCFQILQCHPEAKFLQSNRCRLIHRNEQKNQGGKNWRKNQHYFMSKWRGNNVRVIV